MHPGAPDAGLQAIGPRGCVSGRSRITHAPWPSQAWKRGAIGKPFRGPPMANHSMLWSPESNGYPTSNHFGLREFREKIDERLRQKGHVPDDPEVLRATFAPNADCRNYESFSWYDDGLLYRGTDGLTFVGDTVGFALRRKQIVAIEEEVRRDWLSDRDLRVKWIDDDGSVQELRLADAYENEFKALFHSEVFTKLQGWYEGKGPFIEAPGRTLDAPHFDPPIQSEPNIALTPALMLTAVAQFSFSVFWPQVFSASTLDSRT